MNIQFGKNKNNTNKVKKIYNQGDIITARPQTAKYPYKILSIKEFPHPFCDDIIKTKKSIKNNIYTIDNIYTMKKSFSYVGNCQKGNLKKNELKSKYRFNQSSYDNNYILATNYKKNDCFKDKKLIKIFSINSGKKDLLSINSDNNKNRKLNIQRGFSGNASNKKKVSSYSMSKYIEKYNLNNNKNLIINTNTNENINSNNYNNDKYKINYDDNIQVQHFLSEVINTEFLNNNYIYHTTNNILKNYNKNKSNTRNLIINHYYNNNNQNKISLSNELKPIIIKEKIDFLRDINDNTKTNNFLNNKKKLEIGIKLRKNKSSKIPQTKHKTENYVHNNNIIIISNIINNNNDIKKNKKSLSIETDKTISKEKYKEKEKKDKKIIEDKKEKKDKKNKKDFSVSKEKNKSNRIRFRIKNKYKKKFKFHQELSIKNRKKKIFKSHEINNGFLKYFSKSNNYRGLKYKKNSDIFDILYLPQESEKNDEILNKDYNE